MNAQNIARQIVVNDQPSTGNHLFLSPEWVREEASVIQHARTTDKEWGERAREFSLDLVYMITGIPERLRKLYGGSDKIVVFVKLNEGTVKKLWTGTEVPNEEADFTVTSRYETAKKIFAGELNPATAFINREIKVEPMSRVYKDPKFTARSLVAGNQVLKIAKQLPTEFVPDDEPADIQQQERKPIAFTDKLRAFMKEFISRLRSLWRG
jgi:putative sterol carrier protein